MDIKYNLIYDIYVLHTLHAASALSVIAPKHVIAVPADDYIIFQPPVVKRELSLTSMEIHD